MPIKERFDITASSLGSYFGVGFNTVEQQLAYDLGYEEPFFDQAAQDRIDLGIMLEDAVLNYFEKKLDIKITERNESIHFAFDGKLKCKMDGVTVYNGEPTIVECKVSNAQGYKFTEDKGYYLQCQAYMEARGYHQTLLLGLWQGKPVWRLIRRDQYVIGLIKQVVEFLYDCFNGLNTPANFPYHVTSEYSGAPMLESLDETFTEDDAALVSELFELKQGVKDVDKRIDEIESYLKNKFKNVKYETDEFTMTVASYKRAGSLDLELVREDFPEFDERRYKKPDTEYSTLRLTTKKKKG